MRLDVVFFFFVVFLVKRLITGASCYIRGDISALVISAVSQVPQLVMYVINQEQG